MTVNLKNTFFSRMAAFVWIKMFSKNVQNLNFR